MESLKVMKKWLRDEEDGERANLSYKDLSGLDMSGADLANADLARATLTNADLADAYLTGATLINANLTGADLTDAHLCYADLTGATLPDFQIPQDEDLVVWKKLRYWYTHERIICKLLIPADAARTASLIGKNAGRPRLRCWNSRTWMGMY